ncbi:MAG: 1-acyl-sn-glycerol-3-phosphate acyltransferase [Nevskia sp.]|nr:1-acyl-sn-glycerol-3-phosphate acyltransferase [Nevskia sp.]
MARGFPRSPFPFRAGISAHRASLRMPIRSARLVLHLLAGTLLVATVKADRRGWLSREKLTRWWNRELLNILHVRVSVRGQSVDGPRVIVCNHVSWLDISVLAACELTRFVSKAEVAQWPVAGWLANAAGTFYLRRGAGGTRQLTQDLCTHLRNRGNVVFFPEGTTTDGSGVLKFQPRLFAAALETGTPVQPVALRYGRAENGENIAAFIGDDTLTANLFRLLRERELRLEVTYCPVVHPSQEHDRAALAQAAHAAVCGVVAPDQLRNGAADTEAKPLAA